jgi:endonuclease/exonuclease/phosphatase (EEP) superfamily protein YafD
LAATIAVVIAVISVEQAHSVARLLWTSASNRATSESGTVLRVVTVNCAGGSIAAAKEAADLAPEILLLQESPSEAAVQELARTLFGVDAAIVWSADCTILARGELIAHTHGSHHFSQATLRTPSGRSVEIVCVRLSPPAVRFDLWNPACWREHSALRQAHRNEAAAIAAALENVPGQVPILLGGDDNAPSRDGALDTWSPRLHDAFRSAGLGWGGTVLNASPALRFDQLWRSHHFRPLAVWSVKSAHSDHRLVVGDFCIDER